MPRISHTTIARYTGVWNSSGVRWHMPLIAILRRQRQTKSEFEDNLVDTGKPYLKKQTNKTK